MSRLSLALLVSLAAPGCERPNECVEDIRAQVLDETVAVELGDASFTAELADEAAERDRGWRHRVCAREALLLVPDQPATALPIWGCALVEPIDAYFIFEGEVLERARIEPCPEPCADCPIYAEDLAVDAVLELPAGALADSYGPGTAVVFELP